MERFTISLDGELLARFNRYMQKRRYDNRSEAVRDMLRDRLEAERLDETGTGDCVASLSYVYNHHARELTRRLTDVHHANHNLVRFTTHVHLDHENCLEIAILQGSVMAVRNFAAAVTAETGVRHGKLSAVPVETRLAGKHVYHKQVHGDAHPHVHSRPET
jgi:CopG family nickel-responsive transcriptional regulator